MATITKEQFYILGALLNECQRNLNKNEELMKLAQELTELDTASFDAIEDMFYIQDNYDLKERLKHTKIEVVE